MTSANLACTQAAEETLGIPQNPRPISRLGMMLVEGVTDADEDRLSRFEVAKIVRDLLGYDPPTEPGILGVRVRCKERDATLENLARVGIFAPVHWRDGDWSESGGAAASMTATSFTIPCPAFRTRDSQHQYIRNLESVLQRITLLPADTDTVDLHR
jgi:hypothetical protein